MLSEIEILKEEVARYKLMYLSVNRMNELQHETIQKQHEIIMLQDAELKKLKGEKE